MTERKTILCVDDDPFYCDFYTTVFTSRGYKPETAQDLEEGFKKAQELKPALIILDVMMPEKGGFFDGYGLLQELRKDEKTKDIPIIMISALDQTGDATHAVNVGAADYLPKQELSPDRLFEIIEKLTS